MIGLFSLFTVDVAYLTEDDTLSDCHKVVQSDQCVILGVLVHTVKVELGNGIHGDLVPLQFDLIRTRGEFVDVGPNLVTKCGRE